MFQCIGLRVITSKAVAKLCPRAGQPPLCHRLCNVWARQHTSCSTRLVAIRKPCRGRPISTSGLHIPTYPSCPIKRALSFTSEERPLEPGHTKLGRMIVSEIQCHEKGIHFQGVGKCSCTYVIAGEVVLLQSVIIGKYLCESYGAGVQLYYPPSRVPACIYSQ